MTGDPIQRKIDTRVATLSAAHQALHCRIEQLQNDGFADEIELQRLKKRKLALKDRLSRLQSSSLPDIIA